MAVETQVHDLAAGPIAPGATLPISIDVVVEPVLGAWVWARSTGKVVTTRAATGLY